MTWLAFTIYRRGPNGGEEIETLSAPDEPTALLTFARNCGLEDRVRRDGGGKLYVGNGEVGRYTARRYWSAEEIETWRARYTQGQPFGMPPVLADAIEQAGGLK